MAYSGAGLVTDIYNENKNLIGELINEVALQPLGARGLGGFFVDVLKEEKISGSVSATDYPLQAGYLVSDHATVNPDIISLTGYITGNFKSNVSEFSSLATTGFKLLGDVAGMTTSAVSSSIRGSGDMVSGSQLTSLSKNGVNFLSTLITNLDTSLSHREKITKILKSLEKKRVEFYYSGLQRFYERVIIIGSEYVETSDKYDTSYFSITLKEMVSYEESVLENIVGLVTSIQNATRKGGGVQ